MKPLEAFGVALAIMMLLGALLDRGRSPIDTWCNYNRSGMCD
jgi:hypothetical protein